MKKILIFGLPGSGKSTLANKLAQKLGCTHLNADKVRSQYNDWDFSEEGRKRQAERMLELARKETGQYVILDFVCPKSDYRKLIQPDISIYLDTVAEGRFENTNKIFERPDHSDTITYHFKKFDSDSQAEKITEDLMSFDWRKPSVQMLGRWQPFHDGHVKLFERAIAKTGQVAIQVRDCQNWKNSNPFNYEEVQKGIIKKLDSYNYVLGKDYIIMLVPNITNITYGRDVGYTIEQETFSKEIHDISATKIRKQMGFR